MERTTGEINLRSMACRLHHAGHLIDPNHGNCCRFCGALYATILRGPDKFITPFKATDISIRFMEGGPWYPMKTEADLPAWAKELYASTRR